MGNMQSFSTGFQTHQLHYLSLLEGGKSGLDAQSDAPVLITREALGLRRVDTFVAPSESHTASAAPLFEPVAPLLLLRRSVPDGLDTKAMSHFGQSSVRYPCLPFVIVGVPVFDLA